MQGLMQIGMRMHTYIERDIRNRGYNVYVVGENAKEPDAHYYLTAKFVKSKKGSLTGKPFIASTTGQDGTDLLQSIVNAAWEEGIRPIGAKDLQGELKATRAHLSDMRRMVEKLEDVELDK